uniref:Cytochrome c oxidase subunit 2 n=1 Tax=Groenewaldozyma salmanticensis TaxID=49332 RepID=E5L083_9ASCO|nr:cytochrome c oxidase subunit 2 [Groenewaldozyma salmanticensis]ADO51048.1 cytochrome c oxidase subunit 2 [Groenewaldozyma salmanticensis]
MLLSNLILLCDVPTPWGMYFQDSASPVAEGISELHDVIMYYMVIILSLVTYLLISVISIYKNNVISYKYMLHGTVLEVIWTIFPAVILVFIAIPSFVLLYLSDDVINPAMTVKAIGYQWYWVYEYSDFINSIGDTIQLESYVVPDDMLEVGQLRLLDVDNNLVVPTDTHIRFIVTSGDTIHNFTVPSLGIKVDANPGRLNQISSIIQREGVFYGQCSELCGTAHHKMPIVVEAVNINKFLEFLKDQG